MRLLLRWILGAVALLVVAWIVPGFYVRGLGSALIAVVVIALVNATLGLVLKILTLPLTVLTLGLFWWIINGVMLLVASSFVPGFHVAGLVPAFLGAILLALVNLVLGKLVTEHD